MLKTYMFNQGLCGQFLLKNKEQSGSIMGMGCFSELRCIDAARLHQYTGDNFNKKDFRLNLEFKLPG